MSLEFSQAATLAALQGLTALKQQIHQAGDLLIRALKAGKKVLACGNGGSTNEAQHFSNELVGRYYKNRRSLPAIALNANGSLATCIGNDYGYDSVFSRQIEGLPKPGDVLLMLSSSGNSVNILNAIDTAQKLGLDTVALLGRDGGKAKGKATCEIVISGDSGATAQECHLFLIHHFCDQIDSEFE